MKGMPSLSCHCPSCSIFGATTFAAHGTNTFNHQLRKSSTLRSLLLPPSTASTTEKPIRPATLHLHDRPLARTSSPPPSHHGSQEQNFSTINVHDCERLRRCSNDVPVVCMIRSSIAGKEVWDRKNPRLSYLRIHFRVCDASLSTNST